jgi:hypothetical protein
MYDDLVRHVIPGYEDAFVAILSLLETIRANDLSGSAAGNRADGCDGPAQSRLQRGARA